MIWRIVGSVLGAVLFIIAVPLTLSPIPLGIFLLAISVIILISANPWFAKLIRKLRRRSKPLDNAFKTAKNVLPEPIADPLRQTEVEEDEDEDDPKSDSKMGPPMERFHNPRRLR
ncbi:MAG: FUSC family protein [Pseudomonadota bacterium]